MALLEEINQMKREGFSEQEISRRLQEQGVSPKAITDAFSQSKIKEAVEGERALVESPELGVPPPQPTSPELYTPAAQEIPAPVAPPTQAEYYPPQETAYTQPTETEYYPQEDYGNSYGSGASTDTIIEVAEQVFEEKIKKIGMQMESLKEFSAIAETKLSSFEDRIRKIESIIENLQIKILEKIGSYGQGLESIKKEMAMMQDSFSKTLPKIFESKTESHTPRKTATKKATKKKVAKKKIAKKKNSKK